jgi:HAD superfamily hydrolase (TIGR01484 family)
MIKGLIALDIDGTLTDDPRHIDPKVVNFLKEEMYGGGWQVMFLTGRSYTFGHKPLEVFDFPFYFGTQNGAALFKMPGKEVVKEHFLSRKELCELEAIASSQNQSFLVYSGEKLGDFCYYHGATYTEEEKAYLDELAQFSVVPWQDSGPFENLKQEAFPMLKAFGSLGEMQQLKKAIERPSLACTLVHDPFRRKQNGYYLLVNAANATKGAILKELADIDAKKQGVRPKIIAAGDDENDASMFKVADIPIVMETAPKHLLEHAKVVAKPASECGIIEALRKACALAHA